ncbi:hypothetical protein, conserved [Thermococcus onnurineus NA1]|uniref:IFT52 GIFT domain-containing protein n=1 Tax=Thermococcus onnurineus (strain NA1) TaxID=523850 RepID=B6YUT7_THEON|nr:DUF4350 domain-containing protein [Thermococcus onnurineus]ACJ16123.1 hypothetical protein, conserved [Thermococcus onnurineus NA1]
MKRWSLVLMALLILSLVPAWAIKPVQAATYVPIQEIQSNTTDGDASAYVGQIVTTRGVVTAVTSKGFFIQNGTGPWSGIYVYLGSSPNVNVGDYVEVTGTVKEYKATWSDSRGFTEIGYVTSITKLGEAPVPDPVILPTGDVAQEQWESVLVKVENVVVTNPDLGYGEWEIDDGSGPVRVDDLIYAYTPLDGQELEYVTGVVYYSFENFKIEPRSADDIALPPEYQPIKEIRENWETGKQVVTSGIVIGTKYNGFFIQNGTEPNSGIYVYVGKSFARDVKPGDVVQVNGTTAMWNGLYELDDPSYRVIGHAEVPEPVVVKAGEMNDAYQSMRVKLEWIRVTDVNGSVITVEDDTGSLVLYDYYGIMDVVPGKILEHVIGIGYKYGVIEVYPTDYKLYIPPIGISNVVKPSYAIKGVPMKFKVTVVNNGNVTDNITVALYANGAFVDNVTYEIDVGESAVYEFTYVSVELGDLKIDIQVHESGWGIIDERIYEYKVVPHPNVVAYGFTPYYERLYIKEENNLAELYENFTYTVNKLKQYGVDFGDLEPKIQWINETMKEIQREYSIYNSLKGLLVQQNPYRASYYYPVMVHIRKAALMSKEVMQEIEFVLPHLQDVLEEVEATYQPPTPTPGNETNMTQPGNITITITKVLIDASHGQYYVEEVGVNGLAEKVKSDLGWEVEINKLPLTYDLLKEYDVVIILNPKEDLTPNEVAALQEYVENGGGLFIAGDWYKYSNVESLNAVVEKYGIKFNADELMDDDVNSGRPYYPFVGIYNTAHPAMKFVPEAWKTYYNGQTLTISGEVTWLIKAYDTSYSVDANGNVVRGKGTNPIVAAAVEAGNGRIVAYGSSKAISDSYYGKYIDSNWPFVKGVLLWLAHEI